MSFWTFFKSIFYKESVYYHRKFYDKNPKYGKVANWQKRENAIINAHYTLGEPDLSTSTARKILREIQRDIEYVDDFSQWGVNDYWPTSEEVLYTKKEDCDGQAVAVWEILRRNGFPANDIGMVYVYGHMFACWHEHPGEDDFWVLDNTYLSTRMVRASRLFPLHKNGQELEPKYGFNNNMWWKYERVI